MEQIRTWGEDGKREAATVTAVKAGVSSVRAEIREEGMLLWTRTAVLAMEYAIQGEGQRERSPASWSRAILEL